VLAYPWRASFENLNQTKEKKMLPIDFYRIEDFLTDEEKVVQEAAARLVDKEILPVIADSFEEGKFLHGIVEKVAGQGFLGACIDEKYGGAGIGEVAYGLMMHELERGDSGIRSFASVQHSLVAYPIMIFGSEEQKKRWLPALVNGKKIGCFGLTEPDFGSDPAGMLTTARIDGDEFVLNGSKAWITNAPIADISVIWAKFDGTIRSFIVEGKPKGFEVIPTKHKFSMRASTTGSIFLHDVRIPKDNMLHGAKGLGSALKCLNHARYGIAWGVVGAATACFQEAREYAKTRIMFGKPIGSFQLVQEKLADMATGITAGQLIALQLGRLMERGKVMPEQVSLAKRHNVRMALSVARQARDLLGASGISVEYHTIRHMLNLESVFTYEGTDHIHTLILGQAITGIPAYR